MRMNMLRGLLVIVACELALAAMPAEAVAAVGSASASAPSEVHTFFYLWYGNPATDGEYRHWNHEILQHWTPSIAAQYPKGRFEPPGDVGATFMPARGLYSSNDPATLASQCEEMARAGIDVVVASWWPANRPDGQGVDTDRCVPNLLDAAHKAGLTVAFHLEPYTDRNPLTVRADLAYLVEQYGSHPAFYRHPARGLPMVYVYDTYLSPASEWADLFSPTGSQTIRGTPIDHVVIALVFDAKDRNFLRQAHVDGFYTYFAAQRFSFASTLSSWTTLATWAKEDNMLFIPSVGPGYDDTRIRPWNGVNKRPRGGGAYYREMWRAVLELPSHMRPTLVSLTSFNEWGEGTQLEPAKPFTNHKGEALQDYQQEGGPSFYLDLTQTLVQEFKQQTSRPESRATRHEDEL